MKKILLIVALLALSLCGCSKPEGFIYYSEAISGDHDGAEITCQAYVYQTFAPSLYEDGDLLEVWFDNGSKAPVPAEIVISKDLRPDPDAEYAVGDVLRITASSKDGKFSYGDIIAVETVEVNQTLEQIQKKYKKSCKETTELRDLNNVKIKGTISNDFSVGNIYIYEIIPDNLPDYKINVMVACESGETLSIGDTITIYGDLYVSDEGTGTAICYILETETE